MDPANWSRLRGLLEDALELEEPARDLFIADLAHGSDADLVPALRKLIEEHDCAADVLSAGVAHFAGSGALEDVLDDTLAAGSIVGRYRIVRLLGVGGMGAVYLAERAEHGIQQSVALKLMQGTLVSESARARFEQERRILAGLKHPNIAQLLDAGEYGQAQPFFTMELVYGTPITAFCEARSLGVKQRLQLMLKVISALAYAHQRLIVHRDIKPSNILVSESNEVKLLDFGISKLLERSDAENLTRQQQWAPMTPEYAAPEQFNGKQITVATDIYQVGVLVFRLVAGCHPYDADPEDSLDWAKAVCEQEPLSFRRAIRLRRDTSAATLASMREISTRDLEAILHKALAKNPNDRYRSMDAMSADLEALLDKRPVFARNAGNWYRVQRFMQRHRVAVPAATVAAIGVSVGFATAAWQATVARANAREATLQAARAQAQSKRAEQVKSFVVSLIQQASPESARRGAEMTAVELIRDAAVRVDTELGDSPEAQAELRVAVGSALAELGDLHAGVKQIEAGVAQLRRLNPRSVEFGDALHQLAMHYLVLGRTDEAGAANDEALDVLQEHGSSSALELIAARTTQAKIAGARGDNVAMEEAYRKILVDRTALVGRTDIRLLVDWNNLATAALKAGRFHEAERAYAGALDLMDANPSAPASRRAWLLSGRGLALMSLGQHEDAEKILLSALESAERTLHKEHLIAGSICMGLSELYRRTGRLTEAENQAERAVSIFRKTERDKLGFALLTLGLALIENGRVSDALSVLREAEESYEQKEKDPRYWHTYVAVGLAEVLNHGAKGKQRVEDGLRAFSQRGLESSRWYADSLVLAADAAAALHDAQGELQLLRSAFEAYEQLYGSAHPVTLQVKARLARG